MDYGLDQVYESLEDLDCPQARDFLPGAYAASFEVGVHEPEILMGIFGAVYELGDDKTAHIGASYTISKMAMENTSENSGMIRKGCAAFAAANSVMGAWEYGQYKLKGSFDPRDIAANNVGVGLAIADEMYREQKTIRSESNTEEPLEEVHRQLEALGKV